MRKVLTLLAILAISMGIVFATPGTGSTSGDDLTSEGSASLEVTLDLTDTDLSNFYEIGFSSTKPQLSSSDVQNVTVLKSIALTEASGADFTNPDGTAYIYWVVQGLDENAIDVKMKVGEGLKTSEGDATINWSATATLDGGVSVTSKTADKAAPGAAEVVKNIATGDGRVAFGTAELKIATVDLLTSGATSGKYSGTLTLTISNQE